MFKKNLKMRLPRKQVAGYVSKFRWRCYFGFYWLWLVVAPLHTGFPQDLLVAVAANVQFAMEELQTAFAEESGLQVKTVVGSSGKLTAQIKNGAPYDLFLSADMKYPQELHQAGLTVDTPRVYARGALVLWSLAGLDLRRDLPEILNDPAVTKIAIADPQLAPYGAEALRVLQYYGIDEALAPKLVYGRSIAQVNQYITLQTVAAGLTARSVVLSPEMRDVGDWIAIDTQAYSPIDQGAVMLKHGQENRPEAARRFYEFLFSAPARAIFFRYGYELP